MKTMKKILIIISILIIIAGISVYAIMGFNYREGYSQSVLLETAKAYIPYLTISTIVILIYLMIRYSKQEVIKVILTSILGIIGAQVLVLSIITITRMPISKLIFAIVLAVYVTSIIAVSAKFEENM